jgi:hypothetical protein
VARQCRHRLLALDRAGEDVAPGRVGQRVEHAVGFGRVGEGVTREQTYNHLVVG